MVNDTIFLRRRRGHEEIAIRILFDLIGRLADVLGENVVEQCLVMQQLVDLNLSVRRGSAETAGWLVDHDAGVRQGEAFAVGACGQQDRSHGGGLADAVGPDVAGQHLHRVVDGETRRDGSAWAVDVEIDILLGVFALQEEELRDDGVRDAVVDFSPKEDDAVFQQPRIDVVRAFALGGLLDDDRNVIG